MLTKPTAIVGVLILSNFGSNRCLYLGDGVGDACQNDEDGDGVIDSSDACPKNSGVTATDFSQFQLIYLIGTVSGIEWVILNQVKTYISSENRGRSIMYYLLMF